MKKHEKAEERVQQLESRATAAWESCILLLEEVGELGAAAQHKNIITEGTGDKAICMPQKFTAYIVRHYTEISRDTCSTFRRVWFFAVCTFRVFMVTMSYLTCNAFC